MRDKTLVEFVGGPMDGEQQWVAGEPYQVDFPVFINPRINEINDGSFNPFSTISYRKAYGHYMNEDGVRNAIRYEFVGD